MKLLSMVLLAFAASWGISGCATAPTDIGVGRFLKMYTQSGFLVQQRNYKTNVDCEFNLRGNWSKYVANGITGRCASEDESQTLPYWSDVISSPSKFSETEALHFATSSACKGFESEFTQARIEGYRISFYCDSVKDRGSNPTTVKSEKAVTPPKPGIASLEERLRELKKLADAGLVTNEVYLDRQKKILDGSN